jgi:PP-loop superfamily ATP-utilizing enzyme
LDRLFQPVIREHVTQHLLELGFKEVTLDPVGYRQGSTNQSAVV